MNEKILTIQSNRALQRDLDDEIRLKYPEIEPFLYIRKAQDILQITSVAIEGTSLAVSLIALALQIRSKQPEQEKSRVVVEIQDGDRRLTIDAVEQEADINKIIEDFLKS